MHLSCKYVQYNILISNWDVTSLLLCHSMTAGGEIVTFAAAVPKERHREILELDVSMVLLRWTDVEQSSSTDYRQCIFLFSILMRLCAHVCVWEWEREKESEKKTAHELLLTGCRYKWVSLVSLCLFQPHGVRPSMQITGRPLWQMQQWTLAKQQLVFLSCLYPAYPASPAQSSVVLL